MQNRNILNSPRLLELKKSKRRIFTRKILFFSFGLLVILAGLVYLSRISAFGIHSIAITGNKVVDTEMIRTVVEKEITGNYLWVIPKKNVLLYPRNDIQNKLADQFKRIGDVKFYIKNKELEVSVSERVGIYTWCGEKAGIVESSKTEKCYFLDKEGFIFDEAPFFSGEVYFKFYGPAGIGTYFSKDNFKKLAYFKDALTTIGLKPASLHIYDGDIKIFLSGQGRPSGPYIIFKSNSDFQKLAENLDTALNTEPLKSNFKNKYSSLEYIDLRFGNKVYYKFH